MLTTSGYGKNIHENINAVVADGKFNQAVLRRALGKKSKGVFESPIPLSVMFKDAKKFDIQNPIIGNLLSQVNANKISDAKVKQLLGQAKDEELQARLDRLRKRIDKSDDEDNNNNNNNNINFDDSNMMIIMLVEKNYVENKVILDDRQSCQMITMKKNYSADTTTSRHCLTTMKNYFVDIMISENL